MPQSDTDNMPDRRPDGQASRDSYLPAPVVVVGRSQVNLVVLSRIVELARMKPIAEAPEAAGRVIEANRPAIVVLDGGADMHECDSVLESIIAQKRLSGGAAPFVILLTPNNRPQLPVTSSAIDAVVAKPVTQERLQPLFEQIRDRSKG